MVRAAPHGKAAGLAGPASAVSWPAVETSWKDQLLATSATFGPLQLDYLPPDTQPREPPPARFLLALLSHSWNIFPSCIVLHLEKIFKDVNSLIHGYLQLHGFLLILRINVEEDKTKMLTTMIRSLPFHSAQCLSHVFFKFFF